MKIKSVRTAKNVVACLVGVNLLVAQMVIPPYMTEKSFELEQPVLEESRGMSRKLSKRKNNANTKSKRYTFEG